MNRFAALALVLTLTGCRGIRPSAGLAGMPSEGHVRVSAKQLKDNLNDVEWEWTVVGERNWRSPRAQGMTFELADSYPLNSVSITGGTQIWIVDLVAKREVGLSGSSVRASVQLRGSNGALASRAQTLEMPDGGVGQIARPVLTHDMTAGLPATIQLATLGHDTVELRIDR